MNTDHPIDFVVTWVDGTDPDWQQDYARFNPGCSIMNGKERFRDWDNLQYLFRAFEKFTPWVNKIYFVTYGHLPKWLDPEHPKLEVVKHQDYMDKTNLPVFNSHPIEVNLHRIKGLSEHFVYFNDDCFLLEPLTPEVFFKKGLPVNVAIGNVMSDGVIAPIILNNLELINKNFNRHKGQKLTKNQIIRKHFSKWFYPGYGLKMLDTLLLMKWRVFTGFVEYHHPQPFLKSTFEEIWQKEPEALASTSASKFRSNSDVSQYLMRNWQLVSGQFMPDSVKNALKRRKYLELRTVADVEKACADITSGKYQMYCLNDAMSKGRYTAQDVSEEGIEYSKSLIQQTLDRVLLKPSQFELESH